MFVILIGLGAWQHFSKKGAVAEPVIQIPHVIPIKVQPYIPPAAIYKCDGRQYCSQMGSYEEAKYFIQHCANMKMDGDNDGIPCERQFSQW